MAQRKSRKGHNRCTGEAQSAGLQASFWNKKRLKLLAQNCGPAHGLSVRQWPLQCPRTHNMPHNTTDVDCVCSGQVVKSFSARERSPLIRPISRIVDVDTVFRRQLTSVRFLQRTAFLRRRSSGDHNFANNGATMEIFLYYSPSGRSDYSQEYESAARRILVSLCLPLR